jgi:hypothetical protein
MLVKNTVKFVRVTDHEHDCIFNDIIFAKIVCQIDGEFYFQYNDAGLISGWVLDRISKQIEFLNGKYRRK